MDITKQANERIEELTDKHWEECREIAIYDDELKKAMHLLKEVSNIYAVALQWNIYEARILSGNLVQQVRALETEIRKAEMQGDI